MAGNNIYVQGSYIDVHDNETVYLSVDKAEVSMKAGEAATEPQRDGRLLTQEGEALMGALVEAGLLGADWRPLGLSGSERALVARSVSERLGIGDVWQVFGALWGMKPATLRSYLNKALEQKKSLRFQDRLKELLG